MTTRHLAAGKFQNKANDNAGCDKDSDKAQSACAVNHYVLVHAKQRAGFTVHLSGNFVLFLTIWQELGTNVKSPCNNCKGF